MGSQKGWVREPSPALTLTDYQFAAGVASMTTKFVVYPLDTLKTRLQSPLLRRRDVLRAAARDLRSLYAGLGTAVLGSLPYSLVYTPAYEWLKSHIFTTSDFLAGCFAGFIGSLARVPIDGIKKRVQLGLYPSALEAVRDLFGHQGPWRVLCAVYRGWPAQVLYDVPYQAVQFTTLGLLRSHFRNSQHHTAGDGKNRQTTRPTSSPLDNALIGGLTGIVTSLVTEPMDVVRTRMLTSVTQERSRNMSWAGCMAETVRVEGWRALWKGSVPRLLSVSINSALWYLAYEAVRSHLLELRRRRQTTLRFTGNV